MLKVSLDGKVRSRNRNVMLLVDIPLLLSYSLESQEFQPYSFLAGDGCAQGLYVSVSISMFVCGSLLFLFNMRTEVGMN